MCIIKMSFFIIMYHLDGAKVKLNARTTKNERPIKMSLRY